MLLYIFFFCAKVVVTSKKKNVLKISEGKTEAVNKPKKDRQYNYPKTKDKRTNNDQ